MDVICYKYFYELAKGTSFAGTSEKFSISESALSKSITKLETELGCTLFNRKVRPMRLTDSGKKLMERLTELIPMYEDMVKSLSEDKYVIKYCAINNLENYNLRNYCAEFLRQHPDVELVCEESTVLKANPLDFAALVENGDVDFVVMHESIFIPPRIKKFFLKNDYMAVVMSKNHPLAQLDVVPPARLTGYPILGPGCTRDIINELSHLCGIKCTPTIIRTNEIQLFSKIVNTDTLSLYFSTDYMGYNLDNYGVTARPIDGVGSFPLILLKRDDSDDDIVSDFARGFKRYLDNLPSSQK